MMYPLGLLNVDLETARRRLRAVFDEPAGTLGVAVGTSISLSRDAVSQKPMFRMAKLIHLGLERSGTRLLDYFGSLIKVTKIDGDAWVYALRAACAGCLALYISFSLNLDGSHWALTTCYIVGGQRQTGSILAKSAARIVGTLVGVVASFTLVNAFAQERVLFMCGFAGWLCICAYFSHYQRGHWAYAWVLSGYTTAIVGIPAALAPDQAFTIIASRAENVIIGVVCMGVVSLIAFPETVSRTLVKLVQATDAELSRLLSACLSLESDYSGRKSAAIEKN